MDDLINNKTKKIPPFISLVILYHNFVNISSVVVQICPKCRCIYEFVNNFWTGRIFERLRKVCGGSNLSTVLLLWGIYIKKCISPVRICLQTRNDARAKLRAEMHLQKFKKTSESKKAEKSLEISAFLVFSCLHLNQTRIMCLQVNSGALQVTAIFRACKTMRVNGLM